MTDNIFTFDNFPFLDFSDVQLTDVIRNAVTVLRCSTCILRRPGEKARTERGSNRSGVENNGSSRPDE